MADSSSFALATSLYTAKGLFADLSSSPSLTEGPFYPDHLPLDLDNDLLVINESTTPAIGTVTQLSGRVLDTKGDPIKGLTIEIWQCDANEVYLHSRDSGPKKKQQGPKKVQKRTCTAFIIPGWFSKAHSKLIRID